MPPSLASARPGVRVRPRGARRPGLLLVLLLAGCTSATPPRDGGPTGARPAPARTAGDGVEVVRIPSPDGPGLVTDVHAVEGARTTLVLYHQGDGSARGEYGFLVPELTARGYNVVLPDLWMGGDVFHLPNRTEDAHPRPESYGYCDAMTQVKTVRSWAAERFPGTRLVTWGSSYTAALVLLDAADDPTRLAAVISFSAAAGPPMEGCRADSAAPLLQVPALLVRPAQEAAMDIVQRQNELYRENGHWIWVADPGAHGSSALHPDRAGDSARETQEALWRFLEANAPA